MNEEAKLNLKKMVKEYGSQETTEKIRKCKHSQLIRNDIYTMLELKKKYNRVKKSTLNSMIEHKCTFLHNNYTNIYNKLKNNVIDVNMLFKFVNILEKIENGKVDQHEASVEVGELLKKIYIDSALRR